VFLFRSSNCRLRTSRSCQSLELRPQASDDDASRAQTLVAMAAGGTGMG
jgi:hypothetical protein